MLTSCASAACELSSNGPACPPPSRNARQTWSSRLRIPEVRKSSTVLPSAALRGRPSSRHADRFASRQRRWSSTTRMASCAGTVARPVPPLSSGVELLMGLADDESLPRSAQRPMGVLARLEGGFDDDQPVGQDRAALDVEEVVAELP